MEIEGYPFVVNETPYCIWDVDLHQLDLRYLKSIDPTYFQRVAEVNGKLLAGENPEAKYAATALRAAYSHGMETLFALIGAAIQAPQCIAGWMVTYRNSELDTVIGKIHKGQPILARLEVNPVTWERLAEILVPVPKGEQRAPSIRRSFGKLWAKLAEDFLAPATGDEYNSIKHGLRVSQGGFSLSVGVQTEPGVPAPPENTRTLGDSQFGNSYFTVEKLRDSRNFRLRRHSHNWNPDKFVYVLPLISASITNVISAIRLWQGDDASELLCMIPSDDSDFERPWMQPQPGITSFNIDPFLDPGWISPMTKEAILDTYPPLAGPVEE